MKTYSLFFLIMFLGMALDLGAQRVLRVTTNFMGITRVEEIEIGEEIEYRTRGKLFCKKHTVAHFTDSLLVFDHAPQVKIKDLRKIKLSKGIHIHSTLRVAFFTAAIGFFSLNTINNLITDNHPIIDVRAAQISAALAAVGLGIKHLEKKRMRIRKNSDLRVIERNYGNLNSK